VFGNAPLDQVIGNAGRILRFLGATETPYYAGAAGPTGEAALEGDNAHGEDGLGGVPLSPPARAVGSLSAVDFILKTLESEPEHSVTLTATGPQTNIAQALARAPETMRRVRQILIMGGCTSNMPAHDLPERCGNITPYAEFNFYMAPADAHAVLQSGLPITLFPMNCTHQLTFTPERQEKLRALLVAQPSTFASLHGLINAPQDIDSRKFNISAVMHDIHTALYLIDPEACSGRRGFVEIAIEGAARGRSFFRPDANGPVTVMEHIADPDKLYSHFMDACRYLFAA
jgi:purine nucleosidase